MVNIKALKNSILAQIIVLISLFFVSIGTLKICHNIMDSRSHYLAGLLDNERSRVEISHILQKKIFSINVRLHDLANAGSRQELERILTQERILRRQVADILQVIDRGGEVVDIYPVNLDNREVVSRNLTYTNHRAKRINLQVIELRAKMAELETIIDGFSVLIRNKIAVAKENDPRAVAEIIRRVSLSVKTIDPFFVRIVENSNRLNVESQQEMRRIEQVNEDSGQTFQTIEKGLALTASLLVLIAGGLVFRSCRRILSERREFQEQLQSLNDSLEDVIELRTAELQREIAERKRAELLMADQAEFLLNTIEALSHPFYVIDADNYQIVLANSAALEAADDLSITCHALTHGRETPCGGADHPCPLDIVKETGTAVVLEHIHFNQEGEKRYVEVHGYPIFDDNGKLAQMIEYSLDITEKKKAETALLKAHKHLEEKVHERTQALEEQILQRKKAQQKLLSSERHYRRLIENITDIITIIDDQGVISYTSPSAEKILGWKTDEVVGSDIRSLIHPTEVQHIDMETLYQHSQGNPLEYRIATSGGDYRILESFIQKFTQEDDSVSYILNSRDITLRKDAEDEALKLKMVVEQSPSSVVITDTEGIIEYVNPAFEDVTGFSMAEVLGSNPRVLQSGKTPPQAFDQLWKVITRGKIWQGEFVNKKKNGEFYEENVLVIPIKNSQGQITNYVAVKENITELNRARKQAESANRAKSNFLSRMSHELRTPLNAINGFSQLMLKSKKNPLNDKQRDMTQQISTAGNHLLQLINEVLDLARIESGEYLLDLDRVDPRIVTAECLALIEPLALKKEISIIDRGHAALPKVRADLTRIKQVMLNLLSNAVKYNHHGGQVEIVFEEDLPGFLRIAVVDHGVGIAADRQKDIFTPFTRMIDNPDTIEGTGIGMTITKQLVEKMGGDIGFESRLDEGSRFWFTLPLCSGSLSTGGRAAMVVAPDTSEKQNRNDRSVKKILYIEDDPVNIIFMKSLFEDMEDCLLEVAINGEEGLMLSVERVPDLILLDLNLPGIDGFQVFRTLKSDAKTEFIPVIAVSADAMDQTVKKIKKMGFNGYLSKPVDIDEFQSTIAKILEVG